ncbi:MULTISPECIES: class I SAM-dependent methyltransferase [Rhizobium/Agrobacterium group]|uniref:class I SAM-dependent methyltransferase n=1 Tax=Rhizobium/Agrobacterium group TaxID=227290 RepID=UPI00110EBFFA|nr:MULTISPECIES: class I SAM-dependent methyltransferase [Rhizobium/Agrobacterium group]NWJ24409.1 class I SAM-dependent methyltransferase [Rhizobium sp. RM]TMV16231.1 class I SAM-dependent methyltransferase [Rhizobium sp. Td3]UXS02755.1 class I SAM-dependent methyltransferase [Agrobacterium tumefaciens]
MSRDAVKTLFHPFAADMLEMPKSGERVLFLGAEAGTARPAGFDADIVAVQNLRPLYRTLQAHSAEVTPDIPEGTYDAALILCGKHRGENENRVAEALNRVKTGGIIVAAGSKEDGIVTLRKTLAKLGVEAESTPKYHGVALWFKRPDDVSALVGKLKHGAVTVEGRFTAMPGMFSHDRVDDGSELLVSRLPTDFDGNAADFGAGWGYLSIMLAEKSPRTARIDLFEADWNALEFAKNNLLENNPRLTARFFWQDLAAEPPKEKYDLIIMNPPFHAAGQAAEPALGQAFIKAAAAALRSGGKLLMVANRGMPYEPILAAEFRNSQEVCRNARFKILSAQK